MKQGPSSNTGRILINGHELYLETHGPVDGRAVILLHHGLGSVNSWKAQIPALVEAGWRVIAYDRWGFGRSDPRPRLAIPNFEDDVQDLHELMSQLGITRAALLGHSDGGTVALHFASHFPDHCTRLVVVAAHIYVEEKMAPGIHNVRENYLHDPRFREGLSRMHGDKTEGLFNNWFNGWLREENMDWDMRPLLKRIPCPVLVVQGEEDEHATGQHARDLAASLQQGELWLVPGASHMLPQERPDEFNQRMLEFLNREPAE